MLLHGLQLHSDNFSCKHMPLDTTILTKQHTATLEEVVNLFLKKNFFLQKINSEIL